MHSLLLCLRPHATSFLLFIFPLQTCSSGGVREHAPVHVPLLYPSQMLLPFSIVLTVTGLPDFLSPLATFLGGSCLPPVGLFLLMLAF